MADALMLGTAILGLLLVLPLFALSKQRAANAWLGLFVCSISSLALADYCVAAGVYLRYPKLWGVFDWPVASVGALFYCYVRSLLGLGNGWRQAVHFLPQLGLLFMLAQVWFFFPEDQLRDLMGNEKDRGLDPMLLAVQLLAAGYALAVLYRLRQYRSRLRENYSLTQDRDLQWLQWLTLGVLILLFVWFPAVQSRSAWLWALMLGRLGLLYAFGWYGLRQQQVFLPPQAPTAVSTPGPVASAGDADLEVAMPAERYARSGMTADTQRLIGERLSRRMARDRDFLESDLKLTELAERIGTSPQLLSEYLNAVVGQNFFDYINGLRVKEVQRLLLDAETVASGKTLLDLALSAGFNSKSTFNTAFKKFTGKTPSAWRAQAGQTFEPIGKDD